MNEAKSSSFEMHPNPEEKNNISDLIDILIEYRIKFKNGNKEDLEQEFKDKGPKYLWNAVQREIEYGGSKLNKPEDVEKHKLKEELNERWKVLNNLMDKLRPIIDKQDEKTTEHFAEVEYPKDFIESVKVDPIVKTKYLIRSVFF